MKSCEDLVEKYSLPKGKCCAQCHQEWQELGMRSEDVYIIDIELDNVVYYICCSQYHNYEKEVLSNVKTSNNS